MIPSVSRHDRYISEDGVPQQKKEVASSAEETLALALLKVRRACYLRCGGGRGRTVLWACSWALADAY